MEDIVFFHIETQNISKEKKKKRPCTVTVTMVANPTHTQLAKDDYEHPLTPLARKLAKVAIRDVAKMIIEKWRTGSDPTGEELAQYVINKYTVQPKNSKADWAIEIVGDWGKNNKQKIKRLESPTVYEHIHEETKRAINSDTVQKILNYLNKI